jgi:hypothetical protein
VRVRATCAAVTVMSESPAEPLADVIARLQERLRPHAKAPVTATRKATDTPPPNGVRDGYGEANTLSSRGRGGRYPNTYRPRAQDFAGMDAATTRPSYGGVKPANGIRVTSKATRFVSGVTPEKAKAIGEDNGYRAWVTARTNTERDAGDVLPASGAHYPADVSPKGNLSPSPRY